MSDYIDRQAAMKEFSDDEKKGETMSDLKPCPFCGEMPRIIEHEYTGASNTYGVRCRCGAQSFQFYEEPSLAANAWNTRKGEQDG